MKPPTDISPFIYDLAAEQFEALVTALLQADGYVLTGEMIYPHGIEFYAMKDGVKTGVTIKHRRSLSPKAVDDFSEQSIFDPNWPHNLLLVTSAPVSEKLSIILRNKLINCHLEILGFEQLQKLICKHSAVADQFLNKVAARRQLEKLKLRFSIIVALICSVVLFWTHGLPSKPLQPLDDRIKNVESALASIRGLEEALGKVKEDMVVAESATREINKKYAEAKELQKLTDVQLQMLKDTLQSDKWWRTTMNYIIGFVLGVASSFVASILYARWKQNQALQSGS